MEDYRDVLKQKVENQFGFQKLNKNMTVLELLDNSPDDFVLEMNRIQAQYILDDWFANANDELLESYTITYNNGSSGAISFQSDTLERFDFVLETGNRRYDFAEILDIIETSANTNRCKITGELNHRCDCDEHYIDYSEVI